MIDNIDEYIKNDKIQLELYQMRLNGNEFYIGITLFNLKQDYSITLPSKAIKRVQINNNLDRFYPTFSLLFEDLDGNYTNIFSHYNEYARIVLKPPANTKITDQKDANLDLVFLVEAHSVKSIDPKIVTYQLTGTLYISKNLAAHINFATNKSLAPVSPYQIIRNLLNQVNYEIKSQNIPACTTAIHYITDQNRTVQDHVRYCLNVACTQIQPPAYLYHHLLTHQPLLINRNFILMDKDYTCNKDLLIPNIMGNDIDGNGNNLIVYNFTLYSKNTTEQFYQKTALQHRWSYDQSKRLWTYKEFKPKKYTQLLSLPKDESPLKTIFNTFQFAENQIRTYTTNYQHDVYSRLHDLQVASNCIQFFVEGNILRDCGQILIINCKFKNYVDKFGGIWQTYSVSHVIEGDSYVNIINAYRTISYDYDSDTKK